MGPGGVVRVFLPRIARIVFALVLASAGIAEAGVSPLWQQLGGSATGNGVSQTARAVQTRMTATMTNAFILRLRPI